MGSARKVSGAGILAALLLSGAMPASGLTVTTQIAGAVGDAEFGCLFIWGMLGTDCSYGANGAGTWAGPKYRGAFYEPGSPGTDPAVQTNEGRISPTLTGQVVIDDNGTPADGSDDVISGTLIVGPATRRFMYTPSDTTLETWSAWIHTLGPTLVSSAVANSLGGYDYVIGSRGFPDLLCTAHDSSLCFGAGEGHFFETFDSPYWSGPSAIGVERDVFQVGNIGATTQAIFVDYSCQGFPVWTNCVGEWAWGGSSAGFSNLLLHLTTDATGRLVSADGFWVQEFEPQPSAGPGISSWTGGTLQFAVVPLPATGWLLMSALGALVIRHRNSARS